MPSSCVSTPSDCAARRRMASMVELLAEISACSRSRSAPTMVLGGELSRESTYARYALSVGTRPAEVCGCMRNPFSSRSLIVLRMVAGETPNPNRRDRIRDPAGSAVWTYVLITASRTRRSRGVSSSAVAISLNMLTTSVMRQGDGERIEAQPAGRSATELPVCAKLGPSRVDPGLDERQLRRMDGQPVTRARPQIHRFGNMVLGGEPLAPLHRILA